MISYFGDFAEDDTVNIPFNTFTSDDPAASSTITNLADADIKVHKDGGLTQIVTDGATVIIDFDSITGNHLITIDTSAHADYATGSEYQVRIEGTTVDGATINAWVGCFSIERAGGVLAITKLIQTAVIANAAGTDVAADIIALKAETVLIVADTNELQGDDVPGLISTLDAVVDTVKAETALIVADTNELQGDDVPGLISTLDAVVDTVKAETVLIVADTNELQADWVDSGRLDLILDAILLDTGTTINSKQNTLQATCDTILVDTAAMDPLVAKIPLSDGTISWNSTALAAINAEVDTALDTTISELSVAAPSATPTLRTAIMLLYMALRNLRTTTATVDTITNDAGTGIATSTLSDDATTFSKGEYS